MHSTLEGGLDPEHHLPRVGGSSEVLLGEDALKLLTSRALSSVCAPQMKLAPQLARRITKHALLAQI